MNIFSKEILSKIFMGIMLMAVALTACSDNEKTEGVIDETEPVLEIINKEVAFNFTSAGNVAKVLKFSTNRDWEIVRNGSDDTTSWLTIFERTGEANNKATVWVAAAENTNTEGRTASFTLRSGGHEQSFSVYQAQKDAIIISGPETFKNLPEIEQYVKVEFATNAGEYSMSVSAGDSKDPWIIPVDEADVPMTRALDEYALYFKVLINPGYTLRTGTITLQSKTVGTVKETLVVSQVGTLRPTITVNNISTFAALHSGAHVIPLELETNVATISDLIVAIPERDRTWVSFEEDIENKTFKIKVAENKSSSRSTTISVQAAHDSDIKQDIKVSQEYADGLKVMITNKTDLSDKICDKLGGTFILKYKILVPNWDIKITNEDGTECDWIKVSNRQLPEQVIFTFSENKVLELRTAIVTIFDTKDPTSKDEVFITQAVATCIQIPAGKQLRELLTEMNLLLTDFLELKGFIDNDGWLLLKEMSKSGSLRILDLTAVTNTVMANECFMDCKKLEHFRFPAGITEIPRQALRRCTSLKVIVVPEGVVTLHNHAFGNCEAATSLYLPSTLKYLHNNCLENLTNKKCKEIHCQSAPLRWKHIRNDDNTSYSAEVGNFRPMDVTLYVPSKYRELYVNNKKITSDPTYPAEAGFDYEWYKWSEGKNTIIDEDRQVYPTW